MKRVFIICALVSGLLTACSDSKKKEPATPVTTDPTTVAPAANETVVTDSTKAAADKKTKDSMDKAHGHSHD